MPQYAPFRLSQGTYLAELLLEKRIAERFGRGAVLITDEGLEDDGVLPLVQEGLNSSGINPIVYNRATTGAKSNIADDAAAIVKTSKARLIIGCGDTATLSIARAAAMLASSSDNAFAFFDSLQSHESLPLLPYVEIPTRNWIPTAYLDSAYLIDSRTRRTQRLSTGIAVDSILMSSVIANALTDKQLSYDLLCNMLSAMEGLHQPNPFLTIPLLSSVFERSLAIIHEFADSYERIDSRVSQIIGIDASFGSSVTPIGPGTALAWAIYGRVALEIHWIAAVLLPATIRVLIDRSPEYSDTVSNLLAQPVENESEPATGEQMETAVRVLLGMADVPIRLRDLDIKKSDLVGTVETAATLCGHGAEMIRSRPDKSL